MAEIKVLTYDGLQYLVQEIDEKLEGKVDAVTGKGLSTNDYTTAEKTKLGTINEGAQVNVIEGVSVNGVAITPSGKSVNIDLTNYALKSDIGSAYHPKGSVGTYSELPTNASEGDVYNVLDTGMNYAWVENSDGTLAWDALGGTFDMSNYYTKTETDANVKVVADRVTTLEEIVDSLDIPDGVIVDQTLSGTSNNAIANSAVYNALQSKVSTTDLVAITTGEIDTMMSG